MKTASQFARCLALNEPPANSAGILSWTPWMRPESLIYIVYTPKQKKMSIPGFSFEVLPWYCVHWIFRRALILTSISYGSTK